MTTKIPNFKGAFHDSTVFVRFVVVVFMILFCSTFFMGIGYVTNRSIGGITGLKWLQLFSSAGTFVAGPFFAVYLISKNWQGFFSFHTTTSKFFILAFFATLAAAPLVSYLTEFNQQMSLPEFLKVLEDWMQRKETETAELTKQFLRTSSFSGFLFNTLVMALIPAVGEELLFRGLIQKSVEKLFGNIHLAIWSSAFIFSAIHLQFYGFIPRMLMGALFGYFLYWSGSILVPMACHFLNNFAIVASYFFLQKDLTDISQNDYYGMEDLLFPALSSLVIVLILCWKMKQMKLSAKATN